MRRRCFDSNVLEMQGHYPAFTPAEMFDYWTQPELIALWNLCETYAEPRLGGQFHLVFHDLGWTVTGSFTKYRPPHELSLLWLWDHGPGSTPAMEIDVEFKDSPEGGTELLLRQRPFSDSPEDQELQQTIQAGWEHFGGRLAALRPK